MSEYRLLGIHMLLLAHAAKNATRQGRPQAYSDLILLLQGPEAVDATLDSLLAEVYVVNQP